MNIWRVGDHETRLSGDGMVGGNVLDVVLRQRGWNGVAILVLGRGQRSGVGRSGRREGFAGYGGSGIAVGEFEFD